MATPTNLAVLNKSISLVASNPSTTPIGQVKEISGSAVIDLSAAVWQFGVRTPNPNIQSDPIAAGNVPGGLTFTGDSSGNITLTSAGTGFEFAFPSLSGTYQLFVSTDAGVSYVLCAAGAVSITPSNVTS